MSGAMRKVGVYLGLLEDSDRYDDDYEGYDDDYESQPTRRKPSSGWLNCRSDYGAYIARPPGSVRA